MTILLNKKVVKKTFLSKNSHLFYNEIYWFKKLKKYQFIPKILNIDYKNFTISISYEGERICLKNKPKNWSKQLEKILYILKKNNCFHSDIKPDNLLVNKKKLFLIDFAQSMKISDLKKNIFFKKRIFYDQYSKNRINLSIHKNLILSNDIRVLVLWNEKYEKQIDNKIKNNRNIKIIDKIKLRKNFYKDIYKDRIFWIDQFYNKKISKTSDKLKNNIFVYIIRSLNPIFKSNKMIFSNEYKIVDHKIFSFKKKIRKNKLSLIHISDNFEESKRNALFFSRTKSDYPSKYFFKTQKIFDSKKDFFKRLNKFKKLKYVVLRDQITEKEDIDILVNDFFLFKRIADCHSYKNKSLNFISNSGDPLEDGGFKVANYIKIKNKVIKLDVRYIGDGYFDTKWQKKILENRKFYRGYYIPSKENLTYTLLYHIVYHKGYIDKKYTVFLKKINKLKTINLNEIMIMVNRHLKLKKYKISRPSDLTIPATYQLNEFSIKNEFQLVKNQIDNRNFSGANKMIYNLLRFQKINIYLNKQLFSLVFYNQYSLIKSILKNVIFKYFNRND